MELLHEIMAGANKPVDPNEEEKKGGAEKIGKIFLSAGDKTLAIIAHVPEELSKEKDITVEKWMDALLTPLGTCAEVEKCSDDEYTKVVVKPKKGYFPLKLREDAINASFAFLRQNGLVPPEEDSDDDVNYAEVAGVEW